MGTAVAQATHRLTAAGVPSPRVDAIALAEHALGLPQLILAVPPPLPDGFEAVLDSLVRRREAREPLQHIVGYATFRQLRILVQPGVFLPRPETEIVAQQAVDEARRLLAAGQEPLVVDLCTGSGVIALSVALEAPGSRVVAIDVDPAAVALARTNATLLRPPTYPDQSGPRTNPELSRPPTSPTFSAPCSNPDRSQPRSNPESSQSKSNSELGPADGDRVEPVSGPSRAPAIRIDVGDVTDPAMLADLDDLVDIVISNPPYIPDDAVPLEREVAEHDPAGALFGGGADGLGLPREVVTAATRLLRPCGLLVMEHADVQGHAVRELVDRTEAFEPATTHRDLTGRDRFVLARRRPT